MNIELIIKTINELGSALADYNHQWSDELRKLYEDSMKELGNNK